MSEHKQKLDMNALSDALSGGGDDQVLRQQASMAAGGGKTSDDSPETLSPSPAASPHLDPQSTAAAAQRIGSQTSPVSDSKNTTTTQESHPDPNVQNIKSMFPDMDVDTIQAVLIADEGNFEQAINTLLQMSDPTYVPPPPFQRTNQQDQDEQLARTLAAQEEEGQRQSQAFLPSGRGGGGLRSLLSGSTLGTSPSPSLSPSYDPTQLHYQPRVRRAPSGQVPRPVQPNSFPDTTTSVQSAWPGPREAKAWSEDINKLAETGFAKAASTFSALRQRGEQALAGVGSQQQQQQQQPQAQTQQGSSRKPSTMISAFSPTMGSNRGFDRDPAPVGDNELAKILARGQEDNRKTAFADRYKKTGSEKSMNQQAQQPKDGGDELGWDDAGRTGNTDPPIRLSDNSGASSEGKSKLKLANSPRNAVSLMEGSAGRGLTSPKRSTGSAGGAAEDGDDDDDGNDLEYVSNPFEDED